MDKKLNFLVIIDDSVEMFQALRYASIRSRRSNGNVVILYTFNNLEFSHWKSVENIAELELKEEAEHKIKELEDFVFELSLKKPLKYIMKGDRIDCILNFLDENKFVSNLILAASASSSGPGPLISEFTGKSRLRLKVPLTIIPSNLTEEQIDNLF